MQKQKKYIFDHPKNVKKLLYILYGCCALLLILDFVISRHITHSWENLWGFYPLYGFVGCVLLVLVATWMRRLVKRDQDYYDKQNWQLENKTDKRANSQENKFSIKKDDPNVDD